MEAPHEILGQPVFYYDLGNPHCYIAAEGIVAALGIVPEWEPVLGAQIGVVDAAPRRDLVERQAEELGLLPLRWPSVWPPDSAVAMLAATYAKRIGRAVAFSLAAFRQAFAGGRDLGEEDTVLLAGAACEMHPTALLKALKLGSVADGLSEAGRRARMVGVRSLPAIELGDRVFQGPGALVDAATAVGAAR